MRKGLMPYIIGLIVLSGASKVFASDWYVNGKLVAGKGEAIVAAARDSKALIEKKDVMEFDAVKGTFKIKKQSK